MLCFNRFSESILLPRSSHQLQNQEILTLQLAIVSGVAFIIVYTLSVHPLNIQLVRQ